MESIPPQIQNQIRQFQQARDSLQTVQAQKNQFDVQARELTRTLAALEGTADDTEIYRTVGGLLVKVKDRAALQTELADQKETMEVRTKALDRQKASLEDRISELQAQIEKALGGGAARSE